MVEERIEEVLSDLPPSAKLVYKVLEYNSHLPQKKLVEKTRLSSRTLRYAINHLEDADLVESRPALYDARQTCYTLANGPDLERGNDSLVDAEWLFERLESFDGEEADERLVHVVTDESEDEHIPGSVALDLESALLDPNQQQIPDRDEIEEILGTHGITEDSTVVLYDDDSGRYAAYVYWILAFYGHEDHRLLNGGLDAWTERGCPSVDRPASVPAVDYSAWGEFPNVRAYRDDVANALTRETVLLDVRNRSEFCGDAAEESELSGSTRTQGHIPGAVNVSSERVFDDGRLASRSELEDLFVSAGVTDDQPVIVYCGIGARSALVWFILSELLRYPDVRNYDGSWTEWSNLVDVPIESEESD